MNGASKRMSKWSCTYVPILGCSAPLCDGEEKDDEDRDDDESDDKENKIYDEMVLFAGA